MVDHAFPAGPSCPAVPEVTPDPVRNARGLVADPTPDPVPADSLPVEPHPVEPLPVEHPAAVHWLADYVYGTIATLVAIAGLTFETNPGELSTAGVVIVGADRHLVRPHPVAPGVDAVAGPPGAAALATCWPSCGARGRS